MLIDDPGALVALDRQDSALKFGIDMVAQRFLEGREQAVGESFEG
jgi:hypothetical protein